MVHSTARLWIGAAEAWCRWLPHRSNVYLEYTQLVIPGYVEPSANMRRILRFSKLTFSISQRSLQNLGVTRTLDKRSRRSVQLLRVVLDDDDGVIGFGDDPDVRTAPLGVVGGAVVGVLTGLSPR